MPSRMIVVVLAAVLVLATPATHDLLPPNQDPVGVAIARVVQPGNDAVLGVLEPLARYMSDTDLLNFALISRYCPDLVNDRIHVWKIERLLDPGLTAERFFDVLDHLIYDCRRNATFKAALNRYLTDSHIIYLSRRLFRWESDKSKDGALFFTVECDCTRMAGYVLGLQSHFKVMLPPALFAMCYMLGPLVDLTVIDRIPSQIREIIRDCMNLNPDVQHWAALHVRGIRSKPKYFEWMPWMATSHDVVLQRCPQLLRGNSEALSALLQVGMQFDLDLETWPGLTVHELRLMAPALQGAQFPKNGLLLLGCRQYDLFVEIFRHRSLVRSILSSKGHAKFCYFYGYVGLRLRQCQILGSMLGVPEIRTQILELSRSPMASLNEVRQNLESLASLPEFDATLMDPQALILLHSEVLKMLHGDHRDVSYV